MRKMKTLKKLFAWVLVCAMFVTLMPVASLAAEEEETVEAINVVEDAQDNSVISVEEVKEETDEQEVEQVTEVEEEEPVVEEEEPETKAYTYDVDEAEGEMQDTDSYSVNADGDTGNAPQTVKTATPNGDGTSKIRLDITGKVTETQDITKANVIFVIDLSNSMDESVGGGRDRLAVAKTALINAATELLKVNEKIPGQTDVVEIGIVSFASTATSRLVKSTSLSDITSTVNGLRLANGESGWYAGGTNWEAALKTADGMNFSDNDSTYIVFLSDGDPTFRLTQAGNEYSRYGENDSHTVSNVTVYGSGSSDNNNKNFTQAVNQARRMSTKKIYSIGCFGNVTKMQSFNTNISGAGYYDATNETALNAALAEIAKAISDSLGQSDVSTTDGVTDLTTVEAETVQGSAGAFRYYKNDQPWTTGAPEAKFENNKVIWDLSSIGTLEDGVTYSVEFDVWPSQEAYDLIADLNNGLKTYDSLTAAQKAQIDDLGGTYALKTNTDLSTSYTYNGQSDTANFDFGKYAMALTSSYISVEKEWENTLDGRKAEPITLNVMKGNDKYFEVKVSEETDWKYNDIAIAPGIIRDGEVLEHGHDYSVAENPGDSYYWDLDAAIYHPMIIDGTLTLLKEDDNGTYEIDGKKYSKTSDEETTLKAKNHRRSYLNLTKEVNDLSSNKSAPKDAKFEYTFNVVDKNAAANNNQVWFSVVDENNNVVKDLTTSATPETGDTGYFIATSGQDFTVEIQAGWNLRIINLPIGSTYSIEETKMPGGFYFNNIDYTLKSSSEARYEEKDPTETDKKIEGTIYNTNTSYNVKYTNDYEGFFYVYHTSMTGSDEGVIETYEMREYKNKTFNIYERTAKGTYYGGYYNNYYYTGKVNFDNPASPTVTGGKAYAGQILGFYSTKATSYKENGKAMHPIVGTVYYLKEVPSSYIQEKVYVRNNKESHASEPFKLNKVEPITCIDDKNYNEHGFYIGGTKENISKLASVFVETQDGKETRNENGKSLFKTPNNGYLVITDCLSKLTANSSTEVTAYWVTPDSIEVTGQTRTITVGAELKYDSSFKVE